MRSKNDEHVPRLTLRHISGIGSANNVLEATLNGKMRMFHVEQPHDLDELAEWLVEEIYETGHQHGRGF